MKKSVDSLEEKIEEKEKELEDISKSSLNCETTYLAEVSTYDPSITLKKFIYTLVTVMGVAGLGYFIEVGIPFLQLEYEEYAAIFVALTPILVAIYNYLKHKSDSEVVQVTCAE